MLIHVRLLQNVKTPNKIVASQEHSANQYRYFQIRSVHGLGDSEETLVAIAAPRVCSESVGPTILTRIGPTGIPSSVQTMYQLSTTKAKSQIVGDDLNGMSHIR